MSDLQTDPLPGHACQVLSARDIFVSVGVNAGDELAGPEEVCPGDFYQLEADHAPLRLIVTRAESGGQQVGAEVRWAALAIRSGSRPAMP